MEEGGWRDLRYPQSSIFHPRFSAGSRVAVEADGHGPAGAGGDGRAARVRLDATDVPAPTPSPIELHAHVAHFTGVAVFTLIEPPVDDDAASDARRDGHVDHVRDPAPGAEPMLAQRGRVGVVVEENRDLQPRAERVDPRHALPTGTIHRVADVAGPLVDRPDAGLPGRRPPQP